MKNQIPDFEVFAKQRGDVKEYVEKYMDRVIHSVAELGSYEGALFLISLAADTLVHSGLHDADDICDHIRHRLSSKYEMEFKREAPKLA